MTSSKPFLGEGGSISRQPCFIGERYHIWNIRMQMFIESQGANIWKAINGPYIIR